MIIIEEGKTYVITKEHGVKAIECRICLKVSFNENDIANKYCGNCKVFHGELGICSKRR